MRRRTFPQLSFVILLQLSLVASGFSPTLARPTLPSSSQKTTTFRSATFRFATNPQLSDDKLDAEKNEVYVQGLIENLTEVLDRWVILRSSPKKAQVQNILDQIKRESKSDELISLAFGLAKRGGFPIEEEKVLGKTDSVIRQQEAEARQKWENFRERVDEVGTMVGRSRDNEPRSALSARAKGGDLFMGEIDNRLKSGGDPLLNEKTISKIKDSGTSSSTGSETSIPSNEARSSFRILEKETMEQAQLRTAELVAMSGSNFDGEIMGIGGLDDVLAQVKRRIWVPLAAPPVLLQELGISPVRGLLLYGMPGCGKTLIARTIGKILSPCRPVTVVSGPELMDKFVGSSEQNVRKVFDEPPDIYDYVRVHEIDEGQALGKVALHVIVMDEFDAMARARGGKGDGNQGEAGVARDSVVNQILAKMDGVDPLPVPTLVIGMTNKRSLIDPALLRPGRFEVQIEVPPPRTQEQRVSILKVHMKTMFQAGRLLVRDAPFGSTADRQSKAVDIEDILTYEELLDKIARQCDGFSGASLAGVARAAASHALERAVTGFSTASNTNGESMLDCLVSEEDLQLAIKDVVASSGDSDWAEEVEESEEPEKEASFDSADTENSKV